MVQWEGRPSLAVVNPQDEGLQNPALRAARFDRVVEAGGGIKRQRASTIRPASPPELGALDDTITPVPEKLTG